MSRRVREAVARDLSNGPEVPIATSPALKGLLPMGTYHKFSLRLALSPVKMILFPLISTPIALSNVII